MSGVDQVDPTLVPGRIDSIDVAQVPSGFGFSEEHELAQKAARRLLTERSPMTQVRKLVDDERGWDPALYTEMAELGWLGLGVSETHGGTGAGRLHVALLLEEMGRVLLPSPFFSSLLAIETLCLADEATKARFLPQLVSGERIASIAFGDVTGEIGVRAEVDGGDFLLTGAVSHVPFGTSANVCLVATRERTGNVALFAVELPTTGANVEAEVAVDSTRRTARFTFERARVPARNRLGSDGAELLGHAQLVGAALLASEMIGAAEGVLGRTQAYAIERQQFGKAIGSFQAVKHPIVDLMIGIELGRGLALAAATLLDAGVPHAESTARMAKAQASDVLGYAVKKGVQLHGGFGFTWDCDIHFFFKRSLWARPAFGDALHHRTCLAQRLLGAV